jgi:DNA-binding NarL/FixJ family response regulator
MKEKIHIMIMDDHQSIVDGYLFRLSQTPQIEVIRTLAYGDDLEPSLRVHSVDVLILDVEVPASPANPNPYPILHVIPKLVQSYPAMAIIVISMHNEPSLVRALIEAGARGYILKNDTHKLQDLGEWILAVVNGEACFSEKILLTFSMRKDRLFTDRQLEVLSLCAAYPNSKTAELADKMEIADSTLRNLLSAVYLKLGVQTRAAAIAKARDLGLITPNSTAAPV